MKCQLILKLIETVGLWAIASPIGIISLYFAEGEFYFKSFKGFDTSAVFSVRFETSYIIQDYKPTISISWKISWLTKDIFLVSNTWIILDLKHYRARFFLENYRQRIFYRQTFLLSEFKQLFLPKSLISI